MARKGTYTALQQLQPIAEDFGQIALDAAKVERDIQLQKAKDAAALAKIRSAEQETIRKAFGMSYEDLQDVITGIDSLDQPMSAGVNSAASMLGVMHKQANANFRLLRDPVFMRRKSNLEGFSKTLAAISERYANYAQVVGEGFQKGELSEWSSGALGEADAVFRKLDLAITANPETGKPLVVFRDPKTKELRIMDINKVLDGRGMAELVPWFDFNKSVRLQGAALGKDEFKRIRGGVAITTQSFSTKRDAELIKARANMGTAEDPSVIAKSIWTNNMGNEPRLAVVDGKITKSLTDKDLDDIAEFYTDALGGYYDAKYVETPIRSSGASGKSGGLNTIILETDTKGKVSQEIPEDLFKLEDDVGNITPFSIPSKTVYLGHKDEKREIQRLFITDTGLIGYEGRWPSGTFKDKPLVEGSPFSGTTSGKEFENFVSEEMSLSEINQLIPQINKIVKGTNIETVPDLVNFLKSLQGDLKVQPKERVSTGAKTGKQPRQ